MTTYNTGNPVPSVDVRDLYDNAENLDAFSNSSASFASDRFGVSRQTLQGIRNASQYQVLGPYAAGLEFTSYNQVFSFGGEFYAPGPGLALPYTTDGSGAPEIALFRPVGDAVLRQDLADPTGATLVGRGASDVDADLTDLETRASDLETHADDTDAQIALLRGQQTKAYNSVNGNVVIGGFAPVRCVNILGDSISYGANAQNIQRDSWVGVFRKMLNLEYGVQNIGWLSAITQSSNPDGTYLEYHRLLSQTGVWSSSADSAAAHIPSGYSLNSSDPGATANYRAPTSQRYMRVWYDGTVSGTIEVVINSIVVQTIITTGVGTGYDRGDPLELATLAAVNNGVCDFTVRCAAGTIGLTGFEFTNQTAGEFRVNNFSRDGRAGRYVSQDVINKACAGCYFVVWALGVNDTPDAPAVADYAQRIDWLIAAAAANRTRVAIIDFRYTLGDTDPIRLESKRAAESIPGAVYLDVAKTWAIESELSSGEITARALASGVHPEEAGHRLVAETLAHRMGLSCTSKKEATRRNQMWNAFDMSASALVNSSSVPGSQTAWRIGERSIDIVVGLTTVPGSLVSIGTIPATEMPSSGFTTVNIKSNPDTSGNTGLFLVSPSGLLRYQPDTTSAAPSNVALNASFPYSDTATWP